MNGHEYRIISNQVGTPMYVADAKTGRVVERESMDEFGYNEGVSHESVFGRTHNSMLPFGFAGGIYDIDTGLVRFGARDYDPETGRFVSKDPILLGGNSTNLYQYAVSDPVNNVDPNGRQCLTVTTAGNLILITALDARLLYLYAKLQLLENNCLENSDEIATINNEVAQIQAELNSLTTPSIGDNAIGQCVQIGGGGHPGHSGGT